MKQILLILGLISFSFAANASILYWQLDVDTSDYSGSYDGAALKNSSGETVSLIGLKEENGEYVSTGVTDTIQPGATYAIYVDSDFDTYSYYIELYNSALETEDKTVYSTEKTSVKGSDLVQYATSDVGADLSSIAPTTIAVFHSDGTMETIPEPTSAILMLFGAALLGLKRKNRSIA